MARIAPLLLLLVLLLGGCGETARRVVHEGIDLVEIVADGSEVVHGVTVASPRLATSSSIP